MQLCRTRCARCNAVRRAATQCNVLQRSATCCSIVRGMGVQLCRTRSTCPRAVRLRKVRHSPILSSIIYKSRESSQSVSVIAHRRAHAGRHASLSYENYHWCHGRCRGADTVMAGNSVPTASGIASQHGYRAGLDAAAEAEKQPEPAELVLPAVLLPGLRACHSTEHPAAGERGPRPDAHGAIRGRRQKLREASEARPAHCSECRCPVRYWMK